MSHLHPLQNVINGVLTYRGRLFHHVHDVVCNIWFDLRLEVQVIYNVTSLLQNNIANYWLDDRRCVKFIAEELLWLYIDYFFFFLFLSGRALG